jgi:uncharacterized membrane protein
MAEWLFGVTLATALGCGLMAGVFFAFSVSVMGALGRLPAPQGISAMQSINLTILNPVFLGVFMGTAVLSAVVSVAALLNMQNASAVYLLAGGVFYLVGCFGVTAVFNVPKNEKLASVAPHEPASAHLWATYLTRWTAWNHVRTFASLAATALLTIGLGI